MQSVRETRYMSGGAVVLKKTLLVTPQTSTQLQQEPWDEDCLQTGVQVCFVYCGRVCGGVVVKALAHYSFTGFNRLGAGSAG